MVFKKIKQWFNLNARVSWLEETVAAQYKTIHSIHKKMRVDKKPMRHDEIERARSRRNKSGNRRKDNKHAA